MKAQRIFYLALVAWGIFYCSQALTPSSYGITLARIHAQPSTWMGSPKDIRGDEFAMITPLFQVAVRNDFKRINTTSPYHEDLRNYVFLPLRDWALIAKPAVWAFHLLPPAYAYAFYFYFYCALFLVGYTTLFSRMGFAYGVALASAVLVYFSSFTQYWYAAVIGQLAWFPWVVLAWHMRGRLWLKLPVVFYVTLAYLLSSMYTPGLLPLSFAAVCLYIAFFKTHHRWDHFVSCAVVSIIAACAFYAYNQDGFNAVAATLYPGQREVAGGALFANSMLWSFLFPAVLMLKDTDIIGNNICEISTLASYFPLLAVCCMQHPRALLHALRTNTQAQLLFAFTACLVAWMLLPIPASITQYALLHKVPPERWFFALGLCWHLAWLCIMFGARTSATPPPLILTLRRVLVCTYVVLAGCALIKIYWLYPAYGNTSFNLLLLAWQDYLVLGLLLLALAVKRYGSIPLTLLVVAAASNVLSFGFFNPLQSAAPIFTPPQMAYLRSIMHNPDNFSASGYYIGPWLGHGAVQNGLGLPSLGHVQFAPQLAFFRRAFGACMSEEDFNLVFNRFAHILVYGGADYPSPNSWFSSSPDLTRVECNTPQGTWDVYARTRKNPDVIFLPRDYLKTL